MPRKLRKALEAALARKSIVIASVETTGKHFKLRIERGDATAMIVTSRTSSDHRSMKNLVCDANRLLNT